MRNISIRNLGLLVFLSCGLLYATRFAAHYDFFRPTPSVAVSDFAYTRIGGTLGRLYDHKGHTVVLHFWATWCPPCIDELPALLDKAATRPDVRFLLISVDKDQGRLRRFLQPFASRTKAENVIMIHDPAMEIISGSIKVSGFPESFFLNSELYQTRHIKGPVNWVSFDTF